MRRRTVDVTTGPNDMVLTKRRVVDYCRVTAAL